MKLQLANYYLQQPTNTYNASFRGKDLLKMPKEEVFEEIKKSINREQFIGAGASAKVYKIKDTKYCVRIPDICEEDNYRNEFIKDLEPFDKVNHIKIKLGAGATVMDYYEGKTLFPLQLYDISRYKLQKEISQMPIKTYSNLLHQIANAIDNEMAFDRGAGNIIIDTKNQELTIIDFYKIIDSPIPTSPLKDTFYSLTSYGAETDTAKKIAHKIILAGIEEFKPNVIPCMDIELFDFKDIIKSTCYLNKEASGEFLNNLIKNFEDLKVIKKKEITDKSYASELEQKIEKVKKAISEYYF